ncbi:MAG: trypsin-like peptidase domain-containing protein [Lachnospiraceae bacterium]|nr:trypsin-like peptidase domain-containing protein [Lachnospiraceae bacterium]
MYENEYGKMNSDQQNQQNAYVTPPSGSYTDYTGYTAGPDMVNSQPPKKKTGKIVAGCIALTLVGLLVGSGVSYAYLSARNSGSGKEATEETADSLFADKEDDNKIELTKTDEDKESKLESMLPTTATSDTMTPAQIAQNCLSSVVAITNYGVTEIQSMWGTFTQDTEGAGSGVIIGQTDEELLILTNYHVVEGNQSLSVVFSWEEGAGSIDNNEVIYATVKDYDAARDIAVIAIETDDLSEDILSKITVATVGSSDDLMLGEQVVAIGNALGYGQSVTTGIVSALNRTIEDTSGATDNNVYIQTDAAINPGNSGGALFNMQGELIGINTAMIGGTTVENMGYAIPISEISGEVESMMNQETREDVAEEERGYLGINIVDVTEEISQTYGLPQGVYISNVASGSGAEKAGLKKEDIITGINGKTVTSSSELTDYLDKYSIGETVTITISTRDGNEYVTKDVDVVLGPSPSTEENQQDNHDQNSDQGRPGEGRPDDESQNGWGFESDESGNGFSITIPFPFGN